MNVKAVIFDCFGVLVGRGFDETYGLAGGDPIKDQKFIENILGETNIGSITYDDMRAQITDRLDIKGDLWDAAVAQSERVNQPLLKYIQTLKSDYKTAILSNANVGTLTRIFSPEQLTIFDEVIVSAEVGMVKPQPEIYKYTADKLGVAVTECIFIDDIPHYVEAAQSLGMYTVHYKEFLQAKQEIELLLSAP